VIPIRGREERSVGGGREALRRRKRHTLLLLVGVALLLSLLPLAVNLGWLGAPEEPVRIAFLPFETPEPDPRLQRAASTILQSLHTRFVRRDDERFTLLGPTAAAPYRDRELLPVEMGRTLRADLVVAGQLRRDTTGSSTRVLVSAQLLRVRDGRALWTGRSRLPDPEARGDRRRAVDWLEDRISRTVQTVGR